MTPEHWLRVFRIIGKNMKDGLSAFLQQEGNDIPLARGAGGDKTFPIDQWAENIVLASLEKIHASGESFTLISEELGIRRFGSDTPIILVDPIDGSNNAKSGIPFFSLAVAFFEGNSMSDLSVGYIAHLAADDEFWTIRGTGAYQNGKRMKTSRAEKPHILAYEASAPATDIPCIMPLIKQSRRARCFGSTALDLAYLASGAIDVFVTASRSRPFDYAAGLLMVQEAGGIMTDFTGASLHDVPIGLDRSVPLLASSNERLHAVVLDLLAHHC
ncbi:MAG: inositol monophosphatase family protein [Nitrospirota bacterium]